MSGWIEVGRPYFEHKTKFFYSPACGMTQAQFSEERHLLGLCKLLERLIGANAAWELYREHLKLIMTVAAPTPEKPQQESEER